jgi:hypothetical protein
MSAPPSPAMSFQGMSVEDKLRYLTEQLAQRDETLNTMKIKTKEYVTKLKADGQVEVDKVKESMKMEFEGKLKALQEENATLRSASATPTAVSSASDENAAIVVSVYLIEN